MENQLNMAELIERLKQIEHVQKTANPQSDEAKQAYEEIDVLYHGITVHDLMFIYHQLGRDLTFEEEADLIMGVSNGMHPVDVLSLPKAATVPYKIKNSRVRQNMTQTELGDKVGLNQAQIAKIENGQTKLNVEMLFSIIDALHGSVQIDFGNETESTSLEADVDLQSNKLKM